MEKIAIIVYGDGGELGDFKTFADNVKNELTSKYSKVVLKYVNRDAQFFNVLTTSVGTNEKIGELHIFSHAIGAGLFLGYKDPIIAGRRRLAVANARRAGRKVNYNEAVSIEAGAIQTEDFYRPLFINNKSTLRVLFTNDAFVKIWGCNSGVSNWIYSDRGITDPLDTSVAYYWRAFNERHLHKLSISQALANFLNVKVFGANSGASIEVRHSGAWISSQRYKDTVGHWPSGRLPHRLVPDRGTYNEFFPY